MTTQIQREIIIIDRILKRDPVLISTKQYTHLVNIASWLDEKLERQVYFCLLNHNDRLSFINNCLDEDIYSLLSKGI